MSIKTLHLTNAWSETSGGVATFYREMLNAANRHERQIRLVVPATTDSVEEVGEFARIYHLSAPQARINPAYRTLYPNQFAFSGSKIQQILRRERPDLVEINDKYTLNYLGPILRLGLAPTLGFRPVVAGLSCERMDRNFATYLHAGSIGQAFCMAYMRWVYFPFFDHHIAVSQLVAEELRQAATGHILPRGVWVLPMGVDTVRFSPSRFSADLRMNLLRQVNGNKDSKLLLYAGRLAPEKNLPLLMETIQDLTQYPGDFRLIIVGDGISRPEMEQTAEKNLPGRVAFLGHVSDRDRLAEIYSSCDFFVHPNGREPFGLTLLEAMASGLVVVAPESGGFREFANPGNSCPTPASAAHFASAIHRVGNDEKEYRRIGHNARATAERFSWERIALEYFALYDKMHSIGTGEEALTGAGASFCSTAPATFRKWVLSASAGVASRTFSGVASAASAISRLNKGWTFMTNQRGES
jgi:alpha-1,6-mannosyltransferase